jgi:hypothetical protein
MNRLLRALEAGLALLMLSAAHGSTLGELHLVAPDARGWPRLTLEGAADQLVRIEVSSDLRAWQEMGRGHGSLLGFPDPAASGKPLRFYRGLAVPRTPADDWKNQVFYPDDPLRSPDPGYGRMDPRWIKFAIVLGEPHRVYFQDSVRYPFHYDFAVARLEPFIGMSRAEFDAISLRRENQQVVLGAVLFARSPNRREMAVQIAGQDPYPVAEVADWIDLVRSVVLAPEGIHTFYFPTYEQTAIAQSNAGYFQSRGIVLGSISRWVWADEAYATGWALGRLVLVPAEDLPDAYRQGRLRPDDLLLIDAVPASIPPVAGIITLSPATPNAHAAILAQSLGIPFVYLADESMRGLVSSWDGNEVLVLAHADLWGVEVRVVNLEGQLDAGLRAEILRLKAPPTLAIQPAIRFGQISVPADELGPDDLQYVGGKAAHFGLLRRSIPNHSPSPAIAFTFDLWEEFMDQAMPGGSTLRQLIDDKLGAFAWPPDMARLQDTLAEIRDLIRTQADFAPATRLLILDALLDAGFHSDRRIRFRSSTNVEDSAQFSGAGLYDSYSGCLGDDLFGDHTGPSWCNPQEPTKRGVFRALRRVYASFYNDSAFLERLRHGLDESQVGMGVLVHYSYPDEIELANGVATLEILQANLPNQRSVNATFVTQQGATPVTNPEGNALPELLLAVSWGGGAPWLDLRRHSSLVPLGATVLDWDVDYRTLFQVLDDSARAYVAFHPGRSRLVLDFEYKKERTPAGDLLSVKQMREVPQPPDTSLAAPWLLNQTNRYGVFQGEQGELFANHRLKSQWAFQTDNVRLDTTSLTGTFYRQIQAELIVGLSRTQLHGDLQAFPNFRHHREADLFVDRWTQGEGDRRQEHELHTWLPIEMIGARSPILLLSHGRIEWLVHYPETQPALDYLGPTSTLKDWVILAPIDPVGPLSLRQHRSFMADGIAVQTSFYWPPEPVGPTAGYTAPLQGWVETRITGLASQPIVLQGEYAQTYRPGHHNFSEEFLFDPHLEPGLDAGLLSELTRWNIRGLAIRAGLDQQPEFWIWGLNETLRKP